MRAVIQRVLQARVEVDGSVISSIGQGICVLVGISRDDTQKDVEYVIRKLLNLKLFEGDNGKRWSYSVKDRKFEILLVSQFTLYCTLKGNKPDFHLSMDTERSECFYNAFVEKMKQQYSPDLVKDGKFGAYMQVHMQNDGPVTITIESPVQEKKKSIFPQKETTSCQKNLKLDSI